ncbi:MAG: DEAD/DEAH box helicase family protein [Ectothiorhodospiraceae bacterium AqS1]|nr:DEAD/DEAH box helicase family protein [Ectothiorhodospiraceae bacterium AqS1]
MPEESRKLIVNKPFDAPQQHWVFDSMRDRLVLEGGRRPAGYYVSDPTAPAQQDRGRFIELDLVNRIRGRVDAWREKGYPGITGTTKKLLDHWHDEERAPRFFFCQLEAIETLIWLTETREAEEGGIRIEGDGGPFRRLCSKLATGTGKTVVMSMLIAWQLCNKVANASDTRFAKHFLIVAPNLTVRRRLEVLDPKVERNYYREFDILPRGWEDDLGNAQVVIHNWHALNWESEEAVARKVGVDKRGAVSDKAYVREALRGISGTSKIVVINDEAHHAWRVPAGARPKGIEKAQVEEATKWVGGLDRIHRVRGISNCFDFSATPFAPSGKKTTEEALFPWIVSDFGLTDAIETGLVKTPRVVVRDDSKVDPTPFKSRLYHIYSSIDVKNDLKTGRPPHTPLPDLVNQAYMLLADDWLEAKKAWKHGATPPVMITVCNSTETAARIKYAFEHGALAVDAALCRADNLLHIDSKVLKEAEEGKVEEADIGGQSDDAPASPKNKRQRAERLRRRINTVGRIGEPGERIQNVISVNMLSEGWDAKTVTHILGLRAFTSQLLCEQVVGRGLRRASYDVNETTGLYEPEYVNVFGVPFSFLPHEEEGVSSAPPEPKHWIEAIKSRRREFGIEWPNVLRIEYTQRNRLEVDWANTEPFDIDTLDTVTAAALAKTLGARLEDEGEGNLLGIDLEGLFADKSRLQTLTFKAAIEAYKEFGEKWHGGQGHLIGQLVLLAEEFMRSKRVRFAPEPDGPERKRLFIALYMTRIVHFFIDAIRQSNTASRELVLDRKRPLCRTDDMLPWGTARPSEPTSKSHINRCVFDSAWEASEACSLDKSPLVQAWVKNDHLKFEIFYAHRGIVRRYRPDFLIRLRNGTMLVLEVKGVMRPADRPKHRAMGEWIDAVNEDGKYGRWAFALSRDPADIEGILERHAAFDALAA